MSLLESKAPELLSIEDIADYLGVSVNTIYWWRTKGEGPRGTLIGRRLRFRMDDVLEWLDRKTA